MNYKCLTIQNIIDYVKANPTKFPNGLDSVIMSGDFECNYTHEKHEIQSYDTGKYGIVVCLGYEMHENFEG